MAEKPSLSKRWEDLRATKGQVVWSCAICVAATLIVGFTWGGWVKGSTAQDMATTAASGARAELAAANCVYRFSNAPDGVSKLAMLKASDSWKRDSFIEEGGWVTMAGVERPVSGAATLCTRQLMDPKPAAIKTSGTTG